MLSILDSSISRTIIQKSTFTGAWQAMLAELQVGALNIRAGQFRKIPGGWECSHRRADGSWLCDIRFVKNEVGHFVELFRDEPLIWEEAENLDR